MLIAISAALAFPACAEKESDFFAPATSIAVPAAEDLEGAWSVEYRQTSTTCLSNQPDSVTAVQISVSGTGADTLAVTVGDAAEAIVGPYNAGNGDFLGTTDPEGAGDQEQWDVRFSVDSREVPNLGGTSLRTLTSDGQPLCERRFDIEGSRGTSAPN